MSGIFSYYTKYSKYADEYKIWSKQQTISDAKNLPPEIKENIKARAKAISEPILLLDNYEHEKAEDSESFYLTYNIELMSIATLLASIPIAVTKLLPSLNKHADKSVILQKAAQSIEKYKKAKVSIGGKNVPVSGIISIATFIGSALFYVNGIKKSMQSQLGIIRKASFDATKNITNDPKIFAVLTKEQQKSVDSEMNFEKKNKSAFVDTLKDKVGIDSSLRSVKEYKINKPLYEKEKQEYFENIKNNIPTNISKQEEIDADINKTVLDSYLRNVEHAVLEPLRRVETIANISYSSLFTGGFLEYLLTDKFVNVLGVKNKLLRGILKIAVPLISYFILNKNISDIENKAILATKYKYLKHFTENPLENAEQEKKQKLPEFLKSIYKDMKEYDKFEKNELPYLKEKMDIKKHINLSPEQIQEAEQLQYNTSMIINNQREKLYDQSVGIKALSETLLGPIDIVATAIGGKLGHSFSRKINNKKLSGLLTGLGAVIAFIPAAIVEAKLTKQQKLSEKIAAMLAVKDIQDVKKFVHKSEKSNVSYSGSNVFKDITTRFE